MLQMAICTYMIMFSVFASVFVSFLRCWCSWEA
jgi:hypothetical protein